MVGIKLRGQKNFQKRTRSGRGRGRASAGVRSFSTRKERKGEGGEFVLEGFVLKITCQEFF